MAKTAQILSNLNENLFDFFDFAVKKFCGSSLAFAMEAHALRASIPEAAFTPCRQVRKWRFAYAPASGFSMYLPPPKTCLRRRRVL
jgi:hypothetical protein